MDVTALFNLSYGMYVVATKDDMRDVGCIANSVIQVSSSPATLAISLNKNNYTTSCIQKIEKFTISILSENTKENVIGAFGFNSSRENDKFKDMNHEYTESGLALLNKGTCAYLECRVIKQTECFSHIVFFAEIIDAKKLADERPMTYDYYHKVIKGKAPKNAPTYVAKPVNHELKYTCDLCGYVYEGTNGEFMALPDSYECPLCGAPKSGFVLR